MQIPMKKAHKLIVVETHQANIIKKSLVIIVARFAAATISLATVPVAISAIGIHGMGVWEMI
jgi:hypothetical protein